MDRYPGDLRTWAAIPHKKKIEFSEGEWVQVLWPNGQETMEELFRDMLNRPSFWTVVNGLSVMVDLRQVRVLKNWMEEHTSVP